MKRKKGKEKFIKPKFVPANKEQELAIDRMQQFIREGDAATWLVVDGKAGTGKTTIVQEAIAPFIGKERILIAALAHKAKLVLAQKLDERFGRNRIEAETIASALAMRMDEETGKFLPPKSKDAEAPIQSADIIIIDEGSMINEEALELIMANKKDSAKVIFLGDIGQLPPIRENEDEIASCAVAYIYIWLNLFDFLLKLFPYDPDNFLYYLGNVDSRYRAKVSKLPLLASRPGTRDESIDDHLRQRYGFSIYKNWNDLLEDEQICETAPEFIEELKKQQSKFPL